MKSSGGVPAAVVIAVRRQGRRRYFGEDLKSKILRAFASLREEEKEREAERQDEQGRRVGLGIVEVEGVVGVGGFGLLDGEHLALGLCLDDDVRGLRNQHPRARGLGKYLAEVRVERPVVVTVLLQFPELRALCPLEVVGIGRGAVFGVTSTDVSFMLKCVRNLFSIFFDDYAIAKRTIILWRNRREQFFPLVSYEKHIMRVIF